MNPLLLRPLRPNRRAGSPLRRAAPPVPTDVASTDAIFLVLRRMRAPLIALIVVFTVSSAGLTLVPGRDDQGNVHHLTAFDAFYVMSYTATTIGFGEIPYSFTTAQRLWMTVSIFATVICWAYSIGALFALLQDGAFREALATQRFRRKVRGLSEPFYLVGGYGQAGRAVARGLDERGIRAVVVDLDRRRLAQLATDQLGTDVPGIEGDVRRPGLLGLAGLDHRHCAGVLALTGEDDANLAVAMTVHLLRPDLPVYCRAQDRALARAMLDFEPTAVVNPYDDYGTFLVLALRYPQTYRLVTWLMAEPGAELPPLREGLADGPWVVAADDRFGREVGADLEEAGLDVRLVDPADGRPDLDGIVGIVAGAERDATNLSLAAHARLENADIFIALRQHSDNNAALLEAFGPDSVFIPTDLAAREVLARITVPMSWSFTSHAMGRDDAWASEMLDRLVDRCGRRSPLTHAVELTKENAPSVVRRLQGPGPTGSVTVGDLLRDSDDRDIPLRAVALVLCRGEERTFAPGADVDLAAGDTLVLAGRTDAFDALYDTLFDDAKLHYVATGEEIPETWVFRRIAHLRRR